MILLSFGQLLIIFGIGVIITLVSVFLGAFIMHRSKATVEGTGFLTGSVPKGQIFTIPTEGLEEEVPAEISARNKLFNAILGEEK
jgi:hypothetical protein